VTACAQIAPLHQLLTSRSLLPTSRGSPPASLDSGRADAGDFNSVRTDLAQAGVWEPRMLGYVDAPDLAKLMSGASVFGYPSLYEGFGLAPLDSMASGAA